MLQGPGQATEIGERRFAARAQRRKCRNVVLGRPARRSGELGPLRALRRALQRAAQPHTGRRRGRRRGFRRCDAARGHRQAGAAAVVTVAAVEVEATRRRRIAAAISCRIGMDVLMVPHVLRRRARLVPAIRGHGRPAELQRQQGEQNDGEAAAHARQSSSGVAQDPVVWTGSKLLR